MCEKGNEADGYQRGTGRHHYPVCNALCITLCGLDRYGYALSEIYVVD